MKLVINVVKEQETIFVLYNNGQQDIKNNFDYEAIEKIIDFIMENDIDEVVVEKNEECSQYVLLLQNVIVKIKTEDFKKCYLETKEKEDDNNLEM